MFCAAAEPNEIKAFIFVLLFLLGSLRDEGVCVSRLNSWFLIGVQRASREEMLMTTATLTYRLKSGEKLCKC